MLKELKAKFADAEKDQDLSVKQNIKSLNEITDKLDLLRKCEKSLSNNPINRDIVRNIIS
jgi:hypothetical protein